MSKSCELLLLMKLTLDFHITLYAFIELNKLVSRQLLTALNYTLGYNMIMWNKS